jgi:hypothetical protein
MIQAVRVSRVRTRRRFLNPTGRATAYTLSPPTRSLFLLTARFVTKNCSECNQGSSPMKCYSRLERQALWITPFTSAR